MSLIIIYRTSFTFKILMVKIKVVFPQNLTELFNKYTIMGQNGDQEDILSDYSGTN